MTPGVAWAGYAGDLLVTGSLAAGAMAWLAQGRPQLWPFATTGLGLAALGALAWAIATPSALATASATALLGGLLLARVYELKPLGFPLAVLGLLLGVANHLPNWWPASPQGLEPFVAYWRGLGWQALGLALGAWLLAWLCLAVRAAQGPRALPQGGVVSDLADGSRLAALLCGGAALAAFAAHAMALSHGPRTLLQWASLGLVLLVAVAAFPGAASAPTLASARLKPRHAWTWVAPAFSVMAWLGLWVLSYLPQS